jgi:hypothetical protein
MRMLMCWTLLAGSIAANATDSCQCAVARLHYGGGGDWYANPSSLPNLAAAVRQRTRVPLCDSVAVTAVMDEQFFRYPLVYMTGHGDVHFTAQERVRLRAFFAAGGFLWADDNYGLDESFRREMRALFPDNPLADVPRDHPIFKSVYALPGVPKIHMHDGKPAQGLGVFVKGRLVLFYTYSADIGDGMEDPAVHNDGPELHEAALKMGVNIAAWFFNPH